MTLIQTLIVVLLGFYLNFVSCKEENNTNNWAILIDTSAYWFNYRHASNILGIYQQLKLRGFSDSNIILMIAEDVACNARNVFPGTIVNNELNRENLLAGDVEIDYRGPEVSVDNLIRLLTNRHDEFEQRNKLLQTDENSNILIFMTGHGGENFMKFRNVEEVSAHDLSAAFNQMWLQKRYKEILFLVDTCQAASMLSLLNSPNIFGIASSKVGESSYSYTVDSEIGLSVVDRFSHKLYEFVKNSTSESNLKEFIDLLEPEFLNSTAVHRADLFNRPANEIKIFDFFSAKLPSAEPVKLIESKIEYEAISNPSEMPKINHHQKQQSRDSFTIDFSKQFNEPSYIKLASGLFMSALVSYLLWN